METIPHHLSDIIEYRQFPLKDMVNQKLVECLPGVFYLYQISETDANIKAWNKNHERVTGYNAEETLDKSVFFFIDEEFHAGIAGGLQNIRDEGYAKQIYASIRTKNGKLKPYVFEGYKFKVKERTYFMGLGIDVSDLVNAKNNVEKLLIEQTNKDKELLALTLQQEKNEKLLHTVLEELVAIREMGLDASNTHKIACLTQEIKSHFTFQDSWQHFKTLFNNIHLAFFSKLKALHPDLTQSELQYCAYIKIQMTPEQICSVLNISHEGLTKKRYRIRRKMNLEKKKKLDGYILEF